jgi:hypothetical protein
VRKIILVPAVSLMITTLALALDDDRYYEVERNVRKVVQLLGAQAGVYDVCDTLGDVYARATENMISVVMSEHGIETMMLEFEENRVNARMQYRGNCSAVDSDKMDREFREAMALFDQAVATFVEMSGDE